MNKLILDKLVINHFRGIKSLTIEPKGSDISICGDNELGKTTTGDSITWLLFGKDMQGRGEKKFSLKTLDADGKEISHLDHSVEGFFRHNGTEVILKKILKEKHTKKRGDAKKTFTGNVTEYYIDGLKTAAGKFNDLVSEIADEQTFRLLTVPFFFAEGLKWEKRREILLDICGDVSDEDVIAGSDKLKDLPGILNGKKAEDYLVHLKDSRRKVNEQLDMIPTRIDENSRNLPDISGVDAQSDASSLVAINKKITAMDESLAGLDSGGAAVALKRSLVEIGSKIVEHENKAKESGGGELRKKKDDLSELERNRLNSMSTKTTKDEDKSLLQGTIAGLSRKISAASDSYDSELNSVFEPVDDMMCSGECGQLIPAAQQESAFNLTKANRLEETNKYGVRITGEKEEAEKAVSGIEKEIASLAKDIEGYDAAISSMNKVIEGMEGKEIAITPEHQADLDEKKRLEEEIAKVNEGDNSGVRDKLQGERNSLVGKRDDVAKRLQLLEDHVKVEKRNDELKGEEDTASAEFDRIEGEIFLIEEFIKTKVYSLGVKVAAKFGDIKFKLFEQAINGGVTPCCDVLVNGVPFGSANNAARVNTGLKIINSLSSHYDIQVPIVVDNAESIVRLANTEAQMIRLVVTEDKKLTVLEVVHNDGK